MVKGYWAIQHKGLNQMNDALQQSEQYSQKNKSREAHHQHEWMTVLAEWMSELAYELCVV